MAFKVGDLILETRYDFKGTINEILKVTEHSYFVHSKTTGSYYWWLRFQADIVSIRITEKTLKLAKLFYL